MSDWPTAGESGMDTPFSEHALDGSTDTHTRVLPILRTKLSIPSLRRELVSRARLVSRLEDGRKQGHRLTLLSAPAGFGKTTLLSEWAHRILAMDPSLAVVWLSLDRADNDVTRFVAHLAAALETVGAPLGIGDRIPFQPGSERLASTLIALVNAIADRAGSLAIVLDDYHLVTAEPIHDAVAFLIEHLPENAHLLIATRADPPLPIALLRGRGQLTEVRQTDLRFSLDEAQAFLNEAMRLALPAEDVGVLTSRTEGWIAGLQMAAVALQSLLSSPAAGDTSRFVRAFAGSNRYILDYLVEEVLQHQPSEVHTFLLQTSILDQLSGPLCDAVLDRKANSRHLLEYLERANLFVVPLDDRREWYRYHRLFADLLQQRLHQLDPGLIPTLHSRASAWCERNGYPALAIEHALSAGAFERAARLIAEEAEATLMRSETVTVLGWIQRLPEELVRDSPSLSLSYAWALLLEGRAIDEIESHLQALAGESDGMAGQVAMMRAFLASTIGEVPRAAELSRQALAQLPEGSSFLRSLAEWISAFVDLAEGDYAQGVQSLERVAQESQGSGNAMVAASARTTIARVYVREGRLSEAKAEFERAIAAGTDKQGQLLPVAGRAMISLADLYREWNDLESAERYLIQGIELIGRWRAVAALPGYITLARVRQARGDASGAQETIERAQQLAAVFDATDWDDVLVGMYQARLWIEQGNLDAAVRWAEEQRIEVTTVSSESQERDEYIKSHLLRYEYPVLARLWLKQGHPEKALTAVESMLSRLKGQGRRDMTIEAHMLQAVALQAMGDTGPALAALARALVLAKPGGYVRIFLDGGPPVAELFRLAAAQGIEPYFARRILDAFAHEQQAESVPHLGVPAEKLPFQGDLVEPLTEREVEILGLLASGRSNREIAQTLFIALGTVKKHLKNVYSKLDVHSRTQAVARARDLRIL